jgi:hypothetical protein
MAFENKHLNCIANINAADRRRKHRKTTAWHLLKRRAGNGVVNGGSSRLGGRVGGDSALMASANIFIGH